MHDVYRVKLPMGERVLCQKKQRITKSFYPVRSTPKPEPCNRYSAVPYPEDCDREHAFVKGDYIPGEV